MKLIKFLSFFLILFLSSCFAPKNVYVEPHNLNISYPTIKASGHSSPVNKFSKSDFRTNALMGYISAIDNKPVYYGWLNGFDADLGYIKEVMMTPGSHMISIEASVYTWENSTVTTSINQVTLALYAKSGSHYIPQVRLIGKDIKVWIQDQIGRVSSKVFFEPRKITSVDTFKNIIPAKPDNVN